MIAFFGFHTVSWNQQPVTGQKGLLASPFIGLFLAVLFTIIIGAFLSLGLWIYSTIHPLTLQILEDTPLASNRTARADEAVPRLWNRIVFST